MAESCEFKQPEISDEGNGWYTVSITIRPKINGEPKEIPETDRLRTCLEAIPTVVYWMLEGIREKSHGKNANPGGD